MPQAKKQIAAVPTTHQFEKDCSDADARFKGAVEGEFRAAEFDAAAVRMIESQLGTLLRHRLIFRAQATRIVNLFHHSLADAARLRLLGSLPRRGLSREDARSSLRVRASHKVMCGVDSFCVDGERSRGEANVDIALFWEHKCLWIWEDKFSVDSTNKNNGTGVMDRAGEAMALRENNNFARISSVGIHPEASHCIDTRRGVAHCVREKVVAKGLARSSDLRAKSQNVFLRDLWFTIDERILACETRPERSRLAASLPRVADVSSLARQIWAAVKNDLKFVQDSIARHVREGEGGQWLHANPEFQGAPSPEQIQARRLEAKLSPAQAAKLLNGCDARMWTACERGVQPMSADRWELFDLKAPKGVRVKARSARNSATALRGSRSAARRAANLKPSWAGKAKGGLGKAKARVPA